MFYSIDLEQALYGNQSFSLAHIACLAANLPPQAQTHVEFNADLAWDLDNYMLAAIANELKILRYGLTSRKGDPVPDLILPPSQQQEGSNQRKLKATAMTIDDLKQQLLKPRKEVSDGS